MSAKTRNLLAWILQGLLGVAFIMSGFAKLHHGPETVKFFASMGLPGWFGYLIGTAELLGGIGLLIPTTVRAAALCLMTIMVGAFVMHATRIEGGIAHAVPVVVLFVLLGLLFWLRNPGPDVEVVEE